jgi:uncharacterized protein
MRDLVFLSRHHYSAPQKSYRFLPFRFMRFDQTVFLANEVGEHIFLNENAFSSFVKRELSPESPIYRDLKGKHFLADNNSETPIKLLATKCRTKRMYLDGFTRLHIFVLSLRCDHSCGYCQVSRVSVDRSKYDMTRETADRALDMVFRVPGREVKIEFQGGEPLLNFELLQYVVRSATERNELVGKDIQFVVCSNLTYLSDEIIDFLGDYNIAVSTSLDGPAFIHNANRPRPGRDSYEIATAGIERLRANLGYGSVAALMTTSRLSLDYPVEIVDEYVNRGFDYIFLRPISPYGFAVRTRARTGYELDAFLSFYKRALNRVIEHNRAGRHFVETYAQIILTKILTPFSTGYVDLQSPSGAGIGAVVYNYDGDVYASDEARMLAEMGDKTFRLGSLREHSYEQLFGGELIRALVAASCVETLPGCAECAFQSYCGCDPIENHATQGSLVGHRPTSNFCHRNMEIIKHLLRLYHGDDPFIRQLFWSWVQNTPADDLVAAV